MIAFIDRFGRLHSLRVALAAYTIGIFQELLVAAQPLPDQKIAPEVNLTLFDQIRPAIFEPFIDAIAFVRVHNGQCGPSAKKQRASKGRAAQDNTQDAQWMEMEETELRPQQAEDSRQFCVRPLRH